MAWVVGIVAAVGNGCARPAAAPGARLAEPPPCTPRANPKAPSDSDVARAIERARERAAASKAPVSVVFEEAPRDIHLGPDLGDFTYAEGPRLHVVRGSSPLPTILEVRGIVVTAVASSDGTRAAVVTTANGAIGGPATLALLDLEASEPRVLATAAWAQASLGGPFGFFDLDRKFVFGTSPGNFGLATELQVLDGKSGRALATFATPQATHPGAAPRPGPEERLGIAQADLSDDGRTLVAAFFDETIAVWDVASGARVAELRPRGAGLVSNSTRAYVTDGKTMIAYPTPRGVGVFRLDTRSVESPWTAPGCEPVERLGFDPRMRLVASGSTRGILCVWDAVTGRSVRTFDLHAFTQPGDVAFYAVEFRSPGVVDAETSDANTRAFEVRSGLALTHPPPPTYGNDLVDGDLIATREGNAQRIRSLVTGRTPRWGPEPAFDVRSVEFLPNALVLRGPAGAMTLGAGGVEMNARLTPPPKLQSADGRLAAARWSEKRGAEEVPCVRLSDNATGRTLKDYCHPSPPPPAGEPHRKPRVVGIGELAFVGNTHLVYSVLFDTGQRDDLTHAGLYAVDLSTLAMVQVPLRNEYVLALAPHPRRPRVGLVELQGIELVDLGTGRAIARQETPYSETAHAAFRPDGDELAVVLQDRTSEVRFFDGDSLTPKAPLPIEAPPSGLGYSNDGRRLAVVASDNTWIFEAGSHRPVVGIRATDGAAAARAPDGRVELVGDRAVAARLLLCASPAHVDAFEVCGPRFEARGLVEAALGR
jgi:WD40 repeat protein